MNCSSQYCAVVTRKDGCFLPPHHSHRLKVRSTNQQCKNNLAVTTFEYIKTIGTPFAYLLSQYSEDFFMLLLICILSYVSPSKKNTHLDTKTELKYLRLFH